MDRKGGHIASMQATKPLNSFVRKGTTPKELRVNAQEQIGKSMQKLSAKMVNPFL